MSDNINQSDPVLIYILAASHSGSTLTAMLLNAHPDICTAGELKATNLGDTARYRCSCQELISECPFWNSVSSRMRGRGLEYDVCDSKTSLRDIPNGLARRLLQPLHRGKLLEFVRDALLSITPGWRSYYPVWCERNRELVRSIAGTAGVGYVADSSKIALRLKYLRRFPGLEVKVIRLVRDGRAVALTYMDPANFADARDPARRGGGSGDQGNTDHALTMEQAAAEWRRSNEEAEAVLRTMSEDKWLQIRYEDLCTKTRPTMNAVHSFLGVDESYAFERFRSATHHVVGNGMRLDISNEIQLDDRWRQELNSSNLAVFERVAGSLNRQYGYQ